MLVRVLFLFLALLAAGVATANPVNLALRRPTAQSSTMEGKDGYSSAKGVDGRKYDSSLFHTEMEDNPWWEVDLGAEYAIDNVTLYNRVGCCQERIAGAQVLLSSDAVNYLLIAKLGNESFRNRRVDVGGLTARFVRIQLPGRQYLHLQEVEVYQYGTWQPPSKRATGQRVRVTQPGPWTVDTTGKSTTRTTTSARGAAIEGQWSVNFNNYRGTMWFTRSGSGWTGRLTLGGAAEEALTNITLDEATGRITFLRPRANQQYTGTWNGDSMSGRFDNRYNWSATRQGTGTAATSASSSTTKAATASSPTTKSSTASSSTTKTATANPATRVTTSARSTAIEGQWSVNFNGHRGTMWFTRSGSGWTGRLTLGGGEEALTNITLNEATGRIAFLRPRANQQYTGTWNGDSMSGRFDNRYNWSATRQGTGTAATSASSPTTKTATAKPATRATTSARGATIEGQWSVNFNGHRGTMRLTRSGSGWTGRLTLGGAAEEALTNITLDEATGRIAFLRPRANQQYTGTWNGNAMSGRFDNRYNWSATR